LQRRPPKQTSSRLLLVRGSGRKAARSTKCSFAQSSGSCSRVYTCKALLQTSPNCCTYAAACTPCDRTAKHGAQGPDCSGFPHCKSSAYDLASAALAKHNFPE